VLEYLQACFEERETLVVVFHLATKIPQTKDEKYVAGAEENLFGLESSVTYKGT
jgi:hypothetical protein